MVVINADAHSEHVQAVICTLNWDGLGDLLVFSHCEAFKQVAHYFIINNISTLYALYLNKALVDSAVHSEHRKVIKCDFKPGSVERSIDLDRGCTSAAAQLSSR
jgi:hypothetical protein